MTVKRPIYWFRKIEFDVPFFQVTNKWYWFLKVDIYVFFIFRNLRRGMTERTKVNFVRKISLINRCYGTYQEFICLPSSSNDTITSVNLGLWDNVEVLINGGFYKGAQRRAPPWPHFLYFHTVFGNIYVGDPLWV